MPDAARTIAAESPFGPEPIIVAVDIPPAFYNPPKTECRLEVRLIHNRSRAYRLFRGGLLDVTAELISHGREQFIPLRQHVLYRLARADWLPDEKAVSGRG